jgi:hypothetical protein
MCKCAAYGNCGLEPACGMQGLRAETCTRLLGAPFWQHHRQETACAEQLGGSTCNVSFCMFSNKHT